MLKIAKNGQILQLSLQFWLQLDFFLQVPPPHPTSSPSGTDGDQKFLSPTIKNLEEKTLHCGIEKG